MALLPSRDDPFTLVVGMTGVKMGDRLVQVGCADGGRLAAVASKVGLSGRAVAVHTKKEAGARPQPPGSAEIPRFSVGAAYRTTPW